MVTVLLLNGVGSAGKGSIAKALQKLVERPFLHVEMDAFLAMLPARYMDHPDGLSFEERREDNHTSALVKTGPVAGRVLSGMRQSVAALAHAGNNLRECPKLCVWGLAHAVKTGHLLNRSGYRIANRFRAATHSLTHRPDFSKLRMAR